MGRYFYGNQEVFRICTYPFDCSNIGIFWIETFRRKQFSTISNRLDNMKSSVGHVPYFNMVSPDISARAISDEKCL